MSLEKHSGVSFLLLEVLSLNPHNRLEGTNEETGAPRGDVISPPKTTILRHHRPPDGYTN